MNRLLFISISFIITLNSTQGQVQYFNNIYNQNSTLSNIICLNDTLYCLGANGGNQNILGLKLDSNGNILDENISPLDADLFVPQYGSSMSTKLNQNGFLFGSSGSQNNEEWAEVYSFDLDFDLLWTYKNFSPNPDTMFMEYFTVKEFSFGIYACGKITYDLTSEAGQDFSNLLMTKLDANGDLLWTQEYDWSEIIGQEYFLRISQIYEMPNNEILICGARYHDWNPILIKMTSDGDILDWYEWGSELNDWMPYCVPQDDGMVMVAYSITSQYIGGDPGNPMSNLHLMNFDFNSMEPSWDIEYPEDLTYSFYFDMLQLSDGGFMIGGSVVHTDEINHPTTTYLTYIQKTDSLGNFEWLKYYFHEDPNPEEEELYEWNEIFDMDNTSDGGVVAAGRYWDAEPGQGQFAWVFKIDECGDMEDQGCPNATHVLDHTALENPELITYPNPAQDYITLEYAPSWLSTGYQVELLDLRGKVLENQNIRGELNLEISHLPSGLYFARLLSVDGFVLESEKILIE